MQSVTDDLVRWLGEQLDEDEREIADPYAEKAWHAQGCAYLPEEGHYQFSCDCGVPARLRREIEAKRKTIEDCEGIIVGWHHEESKEFARDVLHNLVKVYADRPGYREEWRP